METAINLADILSANVGPLVLNPLGCTLGSMSGGDIITMGLMVAFSDSAAPPAGQS